MAHVLRFLLVVLCAGSALAGFEQTLDRRLIDDAIAVGRSRIEAVRTRYHEPYRIQVARSPIDYIDIVTPFRRVALLAQERARVEPLRIGRIPRFGARLEGVPPQSPYAAAANLPGESQPMLGGTIVATFNAGALKPTGVYDVVVSEDGKELARARVNLGTFR